MKTQPHDAPAFPPGHKLDCLIAERVMGWKKFQAKEYNSSGNQIYVTRWLNAEMRQVDLPNFSTRPQDAWILVQKFTSRDWIFQFETNSVFLFRENGPTYEADWCGDDKNEAQAICLVTLEAVDALIAELAKGEK